MKWYADKKRTDHHFTVGDWVYLKLQPYRQTSVALRKNLKLSAKYYGPFQVIARVGEVAYKLLLPAGSKIHPVFHTSLLILMSDKAITPMPQLPLVDHTGQFKVEPIAILDRRQIPRDNKAVTRVLIHWSNALPEDATWED